MACMVQTSSTVDSSGSGAWSPLYGGGGKLDKDAAIQIIHCIYCKDCRMEKQAAERARAAQDGQSPPEGAPVSPQQSLEELSLQQSMDKNKETLKRKLMLRRSVNELVDRGIYPPLKTPPAFAEQRKQLERAKTGDLLRHKIQQRPDRQTLVQQHILEDTKIDPSLHERQRQLKKARLTDDLNDKLAHRPGPLELVQGNILQADDHLLEAIKDGKLQFNRTWDVNGVFNFDDESVSDGAPSPPQDDSSMSDINSPNSIPPAPELPLFSKASPPPASLSKSPQQLTSPTTSTLSSSSKSGSSSNQSKQSRQKKQKPKTAPKAKVIKFHEYKGPPNVVKNQSTLAAKGGDSETPYHIMLQQQQLFLQWQLEFQQKNLGSQQLMMPPGHKGLPDGQGPSVSMPNIAMTTMVVKPAPASSNKGSIATSSFALQTVPQMSPPILATQVSQTATPQPTPQPSPQPPTPRASPQPSHSRANSPALAPKPLTNLEEMKVADLKAELKKRNLPVSGPKPQLIERLRPYVEQQQQMQQQNAPASIAVSAVVSSAPVAMAMSMTKVSPVDSKVKVTQLTQLPPGIMDSALLQQQAMPGVASPEAMQTSSGSPPVSPTLDRNPDPMSPEVMDMSVSSPNNVHIKQEIGAGLTSLPKCMETSRPPSAHTMETPMDIDQVLDLNSSLSMGHPIVSMAPVMSVSSMPLQLQQQPPQQQHQQQAQQQKQPQLMGLPHVQTTLAQVQQPAGTNLGALQATVQPQIPANLANLTTVQSQVGGLTSMPSQVSNLTPLQLQQLQKPEVQMQLQLLQRQLILKQQQQQLQAQQQQLQAAQQQQQQQAQLPVTSQSQQAVQLALQQQTQQLLTQEDVVSQQQKQIEELQRALQESQMKLQLQALHQQQLQQQNQQLRQSATQVMPTVAASLPSLAPSQPSALTNPIMVPQSIINSIQISLPGAVDSKVTAQMMATSAPSAVPGPVPAPAPIPTPSLAPKVPFSIQTSPTSLPAMVVTTSAHSAADGSGSKDVKPNLTEYFKNQQLAAGVSASPTSMPFTSQNLTRSAISFSTAPPNMQPFIFTASANKPVASTGPINGLTTNAAPPRNASLPASPLDGQKLSLGRTSSNPFFSVPMKEPPKYDEAIRIKQQHQSPSPQPDDSLGKDGDTLNETKSQAMDDVLEILIRHGDLPPNAATEPIMTPKATESMPIPPVSMVTSDSTMGGQSMPSLTSAPLHFPTAPSQAFTAPLCSATSTHTTMATSDSLVDSLAADSLLSAAQIKKEQLPTPSFSCNSFPDPTGSELLDLSEVLAEDFTNMDWASDTFHGLDMGEPNPASPGQAVRMFLTVPTTSGSQKTGSDHGSEPDLTSLGIHDQDTNSNMQTEVPDWLDVIMPQTALTPLSSTAPVHFTSDPILTPKTQQEVLELFAFEESDFNTPTESQCGLNWDKLLEPATSSST